MIAEGVQGAVTASEDVCVSRTCMRMTWIC